jgi:LacI family transcriptional regulator
MDAAGLDGDQLTVLPTNALTVEEGRRIGRHLLDLPAARRPTAVFCANDLLGLGVLQHMTQHGVAVPEQLSVVGYDDIEFAAAAAVPLTSVHQPRHEIGRAAARLLLEEARGDRRHEHRHIEFTPELVVRASTAPPRHRTAS